MNSYIFITKCGKATVNIKLGHKWIYEDGFDVVILRREEREGDNYDEV